ncbi:MAG: metallophosphoesterase [Pseudomonadota bacterium]
MELFAIADLHLSHGSNKPMDVFGAAWQDHVARMAEAWDRCVGDDDLVLCPGDLSWALRLDEAAADLEWIAARPGTKILGRGNHDYWWSSIGKVRAALPERCLALQNDAIVVGEWVIAGSRLWSQPGTSEFGPDDDKILRREVQRLEMSLQVGRQLAGASGSLIAAVHYPPFAPDGSCSAFTELLERYSVALCVYGHLHGPAAHRTAVEGSRQGVHYRLVASDHLEFTPLKITTLAAGIPA